MKSLLKPIYFFALVVFLSNCGDKNTYVMIETEFGNMKVMLYDETPKHKENFLKLAKEGYYNDLLFHRVINQFMIQGGDPDSKNAPQGMQLGMGGPGYEIDAEIGSPHFRGALAAARNNNPEKRSSGSQFYIVQGKPVNDEFLNNIQGMRGITYSDSQRKLYKEIGGSPELDNEYTVFGEVVEGMEVIDKIVKEPVDYANRPIKDIKMKVRPL